MAETEATIARASKRTSFWMNPFIFATAKKEQRKYKVVIYSFLNANLSRRRIVSSFVRWIVPENSSMKKAFIHLPRNYKGAFIPAKLKAGFCIGGFALAPSLLSHRRRTLSSARYTS